MMYRLMRSTCLCLTAVLGMSVAASAQTTSAPTTQPVKMSDDLQNIDLLSLEIPTVVTAGRREQKITSVPYAMSVITAEDIRRAGARSIPDALRLAPGMDVAELSYGNAAVSPRGFHSFFSSKTLVLVDGRQIYDPLFGGSLWGNWPFQLEDITRIEVIRGPAINWGANAVNGVINIITKDPKDQQGFTVAGGGGSRGSQKEHIGYGFQDKKLRMRVSSEYEGSDGFKTGGDFISPYNDSYKDIRANVHAIYEASPNDTLTVSGGSNIQKENWPLSFERIMSNPTPVSQANFILGTWEHRIAQDNRLELTGFVNDFYSHSSDWSEYRYQQYALQLSQTFKPADTHTFTWGIDSRFDRIDATNADPFMLKQDLVSTGNIGLYAQNDWEFAPQWTFSLGGRIDYDFYGGFQPSARSSLSYAISPNSQVYAAVSRAFQMPPAGRRMIDFPLAGPAIRTTTDSGVHAETLIAYELGYRSRFFDRLDVNANVYWNYYNDIIASKFQLGPPGFMQIHSDNRYDLSLYGVELDSKYTVTSKLTLLGNYTFEMPDSQIPFDKTDSCSPPRHKFMVGVRHDVTDELHLSSHLYYVDAVQAPKGNFPVFAQRIPEYFRLDLRAEYDFWKDHGTVAVGVRNLIDNHHPEGGDSSMNSGEVPRMVYAEMRISFK